MLDDASAACILSLIHLVINVVASGSEDATSSSYTPGRRNLEHTLRLPKLTAEIKRLKGELQQMTEKLELCREPQAVGDIKAMYESKLLNEDGETAGFMELEEEFYRAHSENQAILQAMPDVTRPANLTSDGKVKVDPGKLTKMKWWRVCVKN